MLRLDDKTARHNLIIFYLLVLIMNRGIDQIGGRYKPHNDYEN